VLPRTRSFKLLIDLGCACAAYQDQAFRTRLTNAFSKKVENHAHAVAVHFMWYNFGRVHQILRCTPAMQAGVTDHVWWVEEVVGLLDFAKTS